MSEINWADIIILSIIALSIVISLIRGFVKEAISLTSWVLAAGFAIKFCQPLSGYITFTTMTSLRMIIAFLLVFVSLVFVGAIINFVVGKMIRKTPFSMPDRILGMFFGAFRGALVVSMLVLLAGLTPFPNDPWWKSSKLVPKFQVIAEWFQHQLPTEISQHFVFPVQSNNA
ncbi:MAG: CvpA family protein [Gammaproteobacteria bacterium]